jgi:hypothetical protein
MFAALYGGIALAVAGFAAAQNSSAGLDFGPVDFAGYNNYVYRDSECGMLWDIDIRSIVNAPKVFNSSGADLFAQMSPPRRLWSQSRSHLLRSRTVACHPAARSE